MKWGLVTALASAALMAVSRDTGQFGYLMLVAPVPLLTWSLRAGKGWAVFALALAAGVAGEAGPMLFYGRLLPMIYGLAVGQGLAFALAVLFMRALYLHWPALAALGYAAMTAALEYLYGLVSPNGSFGALGYDLVEVLPLLQVASVAGLAGLSFLAAIIPAGLAVAISKPRNGLAYAAWVVPVAATLVLGVWQLSQPMGPNQRVVLVTADQFAGRAEHDPAINAEAVPVFAAAIKAAGPADAIVLPEKMFAPSPGFQAPQTHLVAGIDAPDGQRRRNLATLSLPGGQVLTYAKQHMVPGLEAAYIPGHEPLTTGHYGVAICKDMDFAATLRTYGQRDVGLMLVPAWDFGADRYLHGRMAVARAVENGFALARSASDGLMTLTDSHGRILAEAQSRQGHATLVGDVPLGLGHTLYSRIGDLFGQLLTVTWLALSGVLAWRTLRRQSA